MIDPRRHLRAAYFLIFATLIVYLIGNGRVPLWDRDEPRYAQCSRQMLQSGDWVVPHLYDELRTAKPPIIYWCQAAAMQMFGETDFAARFPSAIAMTTALLIVFAAVRRAAGAEQAFWTVLVLGVNALSIVAGKSSLTDAVLLNFVVVGQWCVYLIATRRGTWPVIIALGLADGLGVMTKGPVVIGIHAMTLLGLAFVRWSLAWTPRQWKLVIAGAILLAIESWIGDYAQGLFQSKQPIPMTAIVGAQILSVLILTAINRLRTRPAIPKLGLEDESPVAPSRVAPDTLSSEKSPPSNRSPFSSILSVLGKVVVWASLIVVVGLPWAILLEQRSPGFLHTMIFHEVGERATTGLEGHKGPFGFYLVSIWPTLMPWSLLLPAAAVLGWQRRRDPRVAFAIGSIIGPWLMFEVVRTKLPHYLLPCFVPLAYLIAEVIVEALKDGATAFRDHAFRRATVIWGLLMAGLGLTPGLAALWFSPQPWLAIAVLGLVGIVYSVFVVQKILRGQLREGFTLMGVGGLLLFAVLFRVYLPACEYLQTSVKIAQTLKANGATGREQVVMLDYKEPSLAFYQGGTIREHSNLAIFEPMVQPTPAWMRPIKRTAYAVAGKRFAELPEWAVVTREVWNASQPAARNKLQIVSSVQGLDVADGMRKVEVLVLRRKN